MAVVEIYTFRVDKNVSQALCWYDKSGRFATIKPLDRANAYISKEDLKSLGADEVAEHRLLEYAEAVELLDGYTLTVRNSIGNYYGVPEHQFIASQIKQAVLEAAAFLAGRFESCGINITDATGKVVHRVIDENGEYIEAEK